MVVVEWSGAALMLQDLDSLLNSALCQKILKENVWPSVCDLKLKLRVMQQGNDPWPSQSLDLNVIEMLWNGLKHPVHARKPSNVAELKRFCKEEWVRIPQQ